jgi:hypothetical protein
MLKLLKKTKPRTIRSVIDWHRTLGIWLSAFILFLAVTGMLLHHTNRLKLEQSPVGIGWIQSIYGIQAPENQRFFQHKDLEASQIGPLLFIERHFLDDQVQLKNLIGLLKIEDLIVIGLQNQVLLLDANYQIIEKLSTLHGLPASLSAIGFMQTQFGPTIYLRNEHHIYSTTPEFLEFALETGNELDATITENRANTNEMYWSKASEPSQQHRLFLASEFRARALNWERVLLDIHSGRFFGMMGPWVLDLVGLMLIILACSGIWIWGFKKR